MSDVSEKHAGGRPPALEPDDKTLQIVYGLGNIQATLKECAAVLGVGEATFLRFRDRHPVVRERYEKGQQEGLASLRRAQFKKALEGNTTMLIWLGKNYLEQTDRADVNFNANVNINETKTLRYRMTDDELLAIASASVDVPGSGDGTVEETAGQIVPSRLQ